MTRSRTGQPAAHVEPRGRRILGADRARRPLPSRRPPPLPPGATETVTVPGGPDGIEGVAGERLTQTQTIQFTVAPMSTLRLQQLLAQLGLPPALLHPGRPGPRGAPR